MAEIIDSVMEIAPVWAGHPVGFALLTHGTRQFVAFYDAERKMTVGARSVGDSSFQLARLPQALGWDSHNYVTLALDDDGFLHLSGNMHAVPLVYFRTRKPGDITTFVQSPMVGTREAKATYPRFFRGPKDALWFTYRDGVSGDGSQIYNRWDRESRRWTRALDRELTDGEGLRNAYLDLPFRGPDGVFHLVWIWRETPDASTNHDPSYARSPDLIHWETAAGKPIALPITLKSGDIVDAIPEKGGAVNGNVKLGFDGKKRPIVTYHKYDASGNTQIYASRFENGGWKVRQLSDWSWRWEFGGGGSIAFAVGLGAVGVRPDGKLSMTWRSDHYGSGIWILDPETLKIIGHERPAVQPEEIGKVTSTFPEMLVRTAGDSGASGEKGVRYLLRWETLGPNRDRPRTGTLPGPSMLKLYRLKAG